MQHKIISASILAANFSELKNEVKAVLAGGADYIHFDVMDHHFVPNLSFGSVVCESLRKSGVDAPIDVHLMVEDPEKYIEPFAKARANLLAFHPETVDNVKMMSQRIRDAGMKVGVVLNPDTPIDVIQDDLSEFDLVLLMSVYPGFSGQKFIPEVLIKAKKMRKLIDDAGLKIYLGMDGSVKVDTIGSIAASGVDFFVVGSGLFHAENYAEYIKQLREEMTL